MMNNCMRQIAFYKIFLQLWINTPDVMWHRLEWKYTYHTKNAGNHLPRIIISKAITTTSVPLLIENEENFLLVWLLIWLQVHVQIWHDWNNCKHHVRWISIFLVQVDFHISGSCAFTSQHKNNISISTGSETNILY